MPSWTERIKVRVVVSFFWRSRANMLQAINSFQATEADGVWHLLRGIEAAENPRVRATLFEHLIEEESHADEFVRVYRSEGSRVFVPTPFERKDLYDASEPIWKLIAYVHVGEVDATERFGLIREVIPPGDLKSALDTIVRDEEGHIDLTQEVLLELGATETEIRRTYRDVRMRRAWEHWLRSGKRVVNWVAVAILSGIYFALAPFFFLTARRKLGEGVVEFDNNHLKRVSK